MNITELFADLSFGELSSLNLAQEGTGIITDAGKERIIRFANEGLLKLHTRFILKQNDVLVEMVEWITSYHLLLKFAESQQGISQQRHLYIKDLWEEPFQEDVIRILNVFDSNGCELPLNDEGNEHSVFTPQGDLLQVPHPIEGMALSIGYQAKHVPLTLADLTQEIELPEVLHPALRAWVAWRAFGQVNTQESQGIAAGHRAAFDDACNEVTAQDLVSTSQSQTNNRFQRNGWI
ncbi:hypothetical protein [Paraburkholderia sp. SIMBA_054]|uniref:phage adaptor protein n=1 Tax=Paraburkholderia sp. SIMBA_054 TaxID=3085795 RepID=UPI00397CC5F6